MALIMLSYLMKWRLIVRTTPYAASILILKLVLTYVLHFEGIITLNEIRIIFTSGIFLTGFMLAGTLADYKESEKIPGRMASLLEGLEEMSVNLSMQAGLEVKDVRAKLLLIGTSIHDWFYKRIDVNTLHARLSEYNEIIQALAKGGAAPPIVGRVHQSLFDLRDIITRTHVISRTGFLTTGYALLELLVGAITLLLLLCQFESIISTVFIVFFVELLYVYMYKLICDIDDPFEYDEKSKANDEVSFEASGSTEVPLFPLVSYLKRLESRVTPSQVEPKL